MTRCILRALLPVVLTLASSVASAQDRPSIVYILVGLVLLVLARVLF